MESSQASARRVTRRSALLGGMGLAAGVVASPRRAGAQEATPSAPPAPVLGNTFVGPTSEPALVVAVVLGSDEARAYLCDGDGLNEWFTGAVASRGAFELRTETGIRLAADAGRDAITGVIAFADRPAVRFTALPATGIAGLYDLVATPDGLVRGLAAAGGRIDAVLAPEPLDAPEEYAGRYPVVGFATPPAGPPRTIRAAATAFPQEPTAYRLILLADGRLAGGKKGGGLTTFSHLEIDLDG